MISERFIPKGKISSFKEALFSIFLANRWVLEEFLSGDTLVLLPRVNLDGLFDHIERYKVLTFFGVPAMYRMILNMIEWTTTT